MERGELERRVVGGQTVCELLAAQAATWHLCFATLAAVDADPAREAAERAQANLEMLGSPRELPPLAPEHAASSGGAATVVEHFVPMQDLGSEIDGVLFHRKVPAGGASSSALVLKRRWCVVSAGHMLVYRWKGKEKAQQWATPEALKATLALRLCMVGAALLYAISISKFL